MQFKRHYYFSFIFDWVGKICERSRRGWGWINKKWIFIKRSIYKSASGYSFETKLSFWLMLVIFRIQFFNFRSVLFRLWFNIVFLFIWVINHISRKKKIIKSCRNGVLAEHPIRTLSFESQWKLYRSMAKLVTSESSWNNEQNGSRVQYQFNLKTRTKDALKS